MGVEERRERERQARQAAILDAARALLLEKGFRGTTTKEIAERCELSEATLFFYFSNKEEILASLLFEGIHFWQEGLEKLTAANLDAERKLKRIWTFCEEVLTTHPEYYVISTYLSQPNALVGVSDEVRDEIVRLSGENFRCLAELLESVTGRGNGRHLADTLWSTFLGLMVLRDSRVNMGYERIRTGKQDRAAAFEILKNGLLAGEDSA